jgi:co-chaperonin GroES (HSP10)
MDYSKINPLHGIIVLKMSGITVSEGGIHLVNEKRLDYAEVVAVGPGEWVKKPNKKPEFREVGVKVGNTVVVGPGSGVILEVEIDGEKDSLLFMAENDIVAVVKQEETCSN